MGTAERRCLSSDELDLACRALPDTVYTVREIQVFELICDVLQRREDVLLVAERGGQRPGFRRLQSAGGSARTFAEQDNSDAQDAHTLYALPPLPPVPASVPKAAKSGKKARKSSQRRQKTGDCAKTVPKAVRGIKR